MNIRIKNKAPHNVILCFNSGRTLHLGAGTLSPEITETEVRDNKKLERLVERGVIVLERLKTTAKGPPGKPAEKKTRESKKEKNQATKQKKQKKQRSKGGKE